jgi:hypothetical protein
VRLRFFQRPLKSLTTAPVKLDKTKASSIAVWWRQNEEKETLRQEEREKREEREGEVVMLASHESAIRNRKINSNINNHTEPTQSLQSPAAIFLFLENT